MIHDIVSELHTLILHQQAEQNRYISSPIFISILEMTALLRIREYLKLCNTQLQILEHELTSLSLLLYSQIGAKGTINYIHRQIHSKYPDDIDDTCSALYAIHMYNNELISPHTIALTIHTLDNLRDSTSPFLFNTWCIPHIHNITLSKDISPWISIDPVVLSAVCAFFESIDIPTIELKQYVFDQMLKFNEHSNWHVSEFYHSSGLAFYLISRISWTHEEEVQIIQRILYHIKTVTTNTDISLLISALARLGYTFDSHLDDDNSFANTYIQFDPSHYQTITADALFIEHVHISSNQFKYASSEYLSKLAYIESVLAVMVSKMHRPKLISLSANTLCTQDIDLDQKFIEEYIPQSMYSSKQQTLYIKHSIRQILRSVDYVILKDVLQAQISRSDEQSVITIPTLDTLKVHAIGILGYHLYDKIIDNEISTEYIPICIHVLRQFFEHLHKIMNTYDIYNKDEIQNILNCIDQFNALIHIPTTHELKDERRKNYLILVERMTKIPLDHHTRKSQGTMIIHLITFPHLEDLIKSFFHHFQLARQIADDLEDFDQDLHKYKLTTAYYFLDMTEFTGNNLHRCKIMMKQAFAVILDHCNKAQDATTLCTKDPVIISILNNHLATFKRKVLQKKFEWEIVHELKELTLRKKDELLAKTD